MSEVWIIDTARTPRGIGKVGKGALAHIHSQRLFSTVLKALAERNSLNTEEVDDVIAGCGMQSGNQGSCIARMSLLDAGWSVKTPGIAVERFCGSGLSAVNLGIMGIMSGMQDLVVAGGVESMSHMMETAAKNPMGSAFIDSGNLHLREMYPQPHQGICADLIATLEGISREETELLAVETQKRAAHAIENGYFDKSLVTVYNDDGSVALDKEEFPRPGTTAESLAGLKPSFAGLYAMPLDAEGLSYKKLVERTYPDLDIKHIHHGGNSSGVVDGAGAVVLASPEYAKAHGLKPRAKIITVTTAGDTPQLMLNAPVPAAKKALAKAKMKLSDIDLIEINEAFAAVPIKFMRDLDLDGSNVNVNGGAMALGHPIGATGAMLVGTVLDELERRDLSTGLITLCTGGGMAPATIIERV
ncbi:MAG: acetyl-CoA C-acetyltransferase [Pseudomonadales bacterium]|nr:acetyl-CoA C-acetyltransferase [Pseudomonadales bacterium]